MIHSEKFADNNDKFEIKTAQDSVPSDLNPCQKKAFLAAARHKVILIAGGAGVGKSYVVGKIAELYVEHEYRVALATATGAATGALRVIDCTPPPPCATDWPQFHCNIINKGEGVTTITLPLAK